jgi:hypothetical protein
MKTKIIFYTILSLILIVFTSTLVFAKDAYLDSCSGTKLNYNSAKKACKSGKYPGQTIVTCKNNGKQTDKRTCNSDGEKKGVYLDNCGGPATGFNDLKKACKSEDYFGELLVKCKKGEVKKRMQCEAADKDDDKVVIFKDKCGSDETVEGRNLLKACKNNTGTVLVKCKRKGKGTFWKEKKSRYCQGKKDRFKIRNCSPTERDTLISDYELAEARVDVVLGELENELEHNQDMDKKLRKKMEKVRKKLEKIQRAMDRPRTYVCKANKNLCGKSVAHTLPTGKKVKICDEYFKKQLQIERASIIVHEISHHKTQTTDKGEEHVIHTNDPSTDQTCADANLSKAANNFHNQAEYYEHIIECGLYIPQ